MYLGLLVLLALKSLHPNAQTYTHIHTYTHSTHTRTAHSTRCQNVIRQERSVTALQPTHVGIFFLITGGGGRRCKGKRECWEEETGFVTGKNRLG